MFEKEEPQEEYIVTTSDVYNAHHLYSENGYADSIGEFYESLARIVRCKDCKKRLPKGWRFDEFCNEAEQDACHLFSDHDFDWDYTSFFYVKPDDFCKWGVRKDG